MSHSRPPFYIRAENGTRTHDLLITNELLYQLSYFGNTLLMQNKHKMFSKRKKKAENLSSPLFIHYFDSFQKRPSLLRM